LNRTGAIVCAVLAALGCSSADGANGAASTTNDGGGSVPIADASSDAPAYESGDAFAHDGGDAALPNVPPLLFFNLRAGAFPDAGHPDVAVHVPKGFDPSNHPGLLVFFHGFDNCVANIMGSVDSPCTPDAAARDALHLMDQVDAARINAILVAVELRFDQSTGDPGQLANKGDFHALLHELFAEHLNALLGASLDVTSFDPIVVGTHSGGYQATAMALSVGDVPQIREIDLLDSLYGETAIFDTWMQSNIARFAPGRADGLRLMNVYTSTGGTEANSRAMEANAAAWLADAGLSSSLFDDNTTDTLDAATYAHPVLFKLTSLAHGDVPKYYFQEFAQASGFTPIQ
jgi:hypothetical protein